MSRITLQHRITLLIGLLVTAAIGVSVYLGISAVDKTEETAQREQLTTTAQTVAGHVDDVLERTAGREEHLAQMVANAWSQGESELTTLLDAYPRLLFESDLYLLRSQGELVWSMRPDAPTPRGLYAEPLVAESMESLRSAVGSCAPSTTDEELRACFASPVLIEDDRATGVLLAQIDLARPDLNLFSLEHLNETVHIELVDADGLILATNHENADEASTHAEAVATLRSQSTASDTVHREAGEGEGSGHPVGYAPISTVAGWGVVVEPTDADAVAATGGGQQLRLLLFALAALPVSLAVAWLGTRHVLRPLRALGTRAMQIAQGDLSVPVAEARYDEVGELAQALDSLRINLKNALADARQVRDAQRLSTTRGVLLDGLFTRQEEERQRVAHELHEGTLQSLAALALGLDSLKEELASSKQITRERLTRSRTMALAMIEDLRRLAMELRPPALNELGLAAAIQSHAETRLSEKGVQIHLDASDMKTRPSPLLETSLYRVAQEAVDNVATHAEAKSVLITLRCDGRVLTLVVEDDGDGFDPAEVLADPSAVRGLGILSMQERIALVGGTFSLQSASGKGTRLRAEVPLEREGQTPTDL